MPGSPSFALASRVPLRAKDYVSLRPPRTEGALLTGPPARGDPLLLRRVPGRRPGDRGERPRPLLRAPHGDRADRDGRRRGRSALRSAGPAGRVRSPRRRPLRGFASARRRPLRGLPVAERGAASRAAGRRRGDRQPPGAEPARDVGPVAPGALRNPDGRAGNRLSRPAPRCAPPRGGRGRGRRRDAARLVFAGFVGMMVMNLALASYLVGGPDAVGRLPLWEEFAGGRRSSRRPSCWRIRRRISSPGRGATCVFAGSEWTRPSSSGS